MLKALELSGFKSFADKTRFEFPAGITVIVGPNGSGKSNIVDAIKWVLGEQSAKSLRGKDMSDVIFKGAGGDNGRKPANSATATIVLENKERRFPYDADEVNVSRRVYRSGEAEYLINGETCRLKDIRNMFRGTGIGTDAYSLIEQGKVERMLHANPKERRAIFEEAAGISRFKAKKVEAERRLSRVEGNLIRLADIVEEVGSRYRSVKSQASKASKYKEHSDRLQELRTFVGLKDWRAFSGKLDEIHSNKSNFLETIEKLKSTIAEKDTESKGLENQLEKLSAALLEQQETLALKRERIAEEKSKITLNEARLKDVLDRRESLELQLSKSEERTTEFKKRIESANTDLSSAESLVKNSTSELVQCESELEGFDTQLQELQLASQTKRSESSTLIALISELGRFVSADDSKAATFKARQSQLSNEISQVQSILAARRQELQRHVDEKTKLETEAASKDTALAEARAKLDQAKQDRIANSKKLTTLEKELAGKTQRATVLQELEKKLEGVNAGAKQLLEKAKSAESGPFKEIIGVVADLVSVNVQHAGIVDVALGSAAQYIVVDGTQLQDQLAQRQLRVKGRVGFIQLDAPTTLGADPNADLNGESGVIGRADRLVQVNAQFAPFIRKLLGGTWIVKTLADAIKLRENGQKRVRFVTLDGEIVESDGTVVVGPKAVVTGLVSRRSELRQLHREISELQEQQQTTSTKLDEIRDAEEKFDSHVQNLISENTKLSNQLSDKSVRAAEAEKQINEADEKLTGSKTELATIQSSLSETAAQLASNQSQLLGNESQLKLLHQFIADNETQTESTRGQRTECERKATVAKVQLAKHEQQLESLKLRQQSDADEFEQLQIEFDRVKAQLQTDQQSEQNAREETETAGTQLADLEKTLEETNAALEETNQKRAELDSSRRELVKSLHSERDKLRKSEDALHQSDLEKNQLVMQREQMAERLQEDYGIEIASLEQQQETETELAERDKIDEEITQLRKKIGSIGSVNLDALAELEDLESRYTEMDQQYQDLVQAKQHLESIISRINSDSRRLFLETIEAIRGNFQRLFRQTFGGGQADIILEEGVDPLEAGVEIIATPPGKPEFNNSLLSGGEKALTAVSLLMSIFQFRPSPFCVLDEVDAPFDEANIGRFIDVMKSFLGWTKFVIVTHSKKTMTSATTLYGVTMQESGVSKRVSVRFEDVSEDGEISDEALTREDDNERGVA